MHDPTSPAPAAPAAAARRGAHLAVLALPALLAACTGATVGSGVSDRTLERPPYAAGRLVSHQPGTVAHLPIAYQRGGAQAALFDPEAGPGTPVVALLAEMNAYLDALGATLPAAAAGALPPAPRGARAPDVRFDCETRGGEDCVGEDSRGRQYMHLAVGRPSESWVAWAQPVVDGAGAERLLVLTLEVGRYWPRQRNLRGAKEVELGTGYAVGLPFLTALDRPLQVLQLTGALVDRDGKAVRIAAEGLVARRTNLLAGAVGLERLIDDDDVERLRTARRTDLEGEPLVWQMALRNLVRELTGG
jgi:hypothetical protein